MVPLPSKVTDADLIAFIDRWAALLEREDYLAAYEYANPNSELRWTSELIREVIRSYGDARPEQRVTVEGAPTDLSQRKTVHRWPTNPNGRFGEIWYDLNIDGEASDLTATFELKQSEDAVTVHLVDIHVM